MNAMPKVGCFSRTQIIRLKYDWGGQCGQEAYVFLPWKANGKANVGEVIAPGFQVVASCLNTGL